jgi:hypothetical protein
MAGTKYTRKPAKKLTKRQAEMKKINKGIKKTVARNKKNESTASKALKKTVKKLGTGVAAVASVSPGGTKAKALKIAAKGYKVVKNKLKRRAINKAMKKGGRDGIIKSKLPSPAFERRLRKGLRKEAQKEYGTVGGVKWMKKSQKTGAVPKRGKSGGHPAIPFKGPSNKRSYDRHLKYDSALEKGGKSLSNGIRREAIDTIRHNPSSKMAAREIARRKDKVDTYKKAKTMSKYTKKIAPKAVGLGIGAGGVAAYNKKVPNKGKKNGSF